MDTFSAWNSGLEFQAEISGLFFPGQNSRPKFWLGARYSGLARNFGSHMNRPHDVARLAGISSQGCWRGQVKGMDMLAGWPMASVIRLVSWRVWGSYPGWPDWHGLTGVPKFMEVL